MLHWWRKEKYLRKSDQLAKVGKFSEAIALIDEAQKIYPHADLMKQKAWLLKEANLPEEAMIYIRNLLTTMAEDPVLHLLFGEVLLSKGEYAESKTHLYKSIELGGENLYAEFLLGKACLALGETDKASQYFESMIKYDKSFVSGRLLAMAETYLEERKTKKHGA